MPQNKRFSKKPVFIVLGVLVLLGSIFTGLFLAFSHNPLCVSGSISIGGSTALSPLVSDAAQKYQTMCSQATITIRKDIAASQDGLLNVRQGIIDIGDSDLATNNLDLVDYPVAITPFVIVLNQSVTGVTNLTTQDIQGIYNQGIYNGAITNWSEVGGPDLPIFVVSRTSNSGTRKTFEQYVLNGQETLPLTSPNYLEVGTTDTMASTVASKFGAIGYLDVGTATRDNLQIVSIDSIAALSDKVRSNDYKFWTVEHMYTKRQPSNLTTAFINYILSEQFRGEISGLDYIPINFMPANVISAHPSPPASPGL